MKKKSQVLLSSITTIALSATLIVGSTFALFTSKSDTDISITSGKVDVEATAKLTKAFSAEWNGTEYTDKYRTLNPDGSATFECGGTASYDGSENVLSLTSIAPGDGVEFELNVTNNSSISIIYQVIVHYKDGGPTPEKEAQLKAENPDAVPNPYALYRALKITIDGWEELENANSDRTTVVSEWSSAVNVGKNISIPVRIELPWGTGDALQNEFCNLSIGVYAVQANGHDETNQDVYYRPYYAYNSNIEDVFGWLEDGDTVMLGENITHTDALLVDKKDITLDLNGFNLTLDYDETTETRGVLNVYDGGSLTLTGEGAVGIGEGYRNAETLNNFIIAYNDVGTMTELTIDCDINFGNILDDGPFGIVAYTDGSEGSEAVFNITDNGYIYGSLAQGGIIGIGANAVLNMKGGEIELAPSANSNNSARVASAVYLFDSDAVFNLLGGKIVAKGYNVAAVNMAEAWSTFYMTGGTITLDIDVDPNRGELANPLPCSSAVQAAGDVKFLGGTIEIKSNIRDEEAEACAFLAGSDWLEEVTFGKDATIIVHKAGDGGSDRNYSFLDWDEEIPYLDETETEVKTPETGTPGYASLPEGWEYEGTIQLVRE